MHSPLLNNRAGDGLHDSWDRMNDQIHKLLFIKPSSLGDIVHAMPTLAALKVRFPQSHVTWLVKQQWAEVVARVEGVDQVCAVERGSAGWLPRVPELRAAKFDLVVDLQGLFRSGVMAWLTGCPRRVGFANGREGSPLFYTDRIPVPSADMHAVDRYLLIARALRAPATAPVFQFRFSQEDEAQVDGLLQRHGLSSTTSWIALNVSARWPTKRWPAERFAALADGIQRQNTGRVVFFGGPDERANVAAVLSIMKTKAIDLTGETSPGMLPWLLRKATLLVTNDSGPMHVAAAVRTPVVSMFGPTSERRTGPYGSGHTVLSAPVSCRPCFSRRCHHAVQLECLTAISPEQVLQAVRDHLAARLATHAT